MSTTFSQVCALLPPPLVPKMGKSESDLITMLIALRLSPNYIASRVEDHMKMMDLLEKLASALPASIASNQNIYEQAHALVRQGLDPQLAAQQAAQLAEPKVSDANLPVLPEEGMPPSEEAAAGDSKSNGLKL